MGSVRKLAMFVVIGLVALSTAITVYTANEPNRRDNISESQETLAIQRGTSLYITYCLQCHGPAGLGSAEGTGRIGPPLNQVIMTEEQLAQQKAVYQSDDPVQSAQAEDFLRFRIMYGAPAEAQLWQTFDGAPVMPAFRHDLSVEQLNDLVYLITNGNWNYVYNQSLHTTGLGVCEATPEADRSGMCEGDMHDAYAYPTVPAEAPAEGEGEGDGEETEPAAEPAADATDHAVESGDNFYDVETITAKPGDTITLTNAGFVDHDLEVDGLGVGTELLGNGESQTIVIPEDAEPGEYKFYCSVAGHEQAGMVGTLVIEAAD